MVFSLRSDHVRRGESEVSDRPLFVRVSRLLCLHTETNRACSVCVFLTFPAIYRFFNDFPPNINNDNRARMRIETGPAGLCVSLPPGDLSLLQRLRLQRRKFQSCACRTPTIYIQGVSMFSFPNVKPIWIRYLERFVERYGGSKLERARDLFEQVCSIFGHVLYLCVVRCPSVYVLKSSRTFK